MRIEIEIPKEFENHFNQDRFKDSFERIMVDIKHSLENGECLCAGKYEYETIEKLQKAFENSKQAYDIDKVVEELPNDVCEWEFKDICYTTSIKHYYSLPSAIVKTFNNCPYCGKKIKIVGD